jgi:hypothetical protein
MQKKYLRIGVASLGAGLVALVVTVLATDPLYRIFCYHLYELCIYPDNLLLTLIYYLLLFVTWLLYVASLKLIARDRTFIAIFAATASILAEYFIAQLHIVTGETWLLYTMSTVIGVTSLFLHDAILNFLAAKKAGYATITGIALVAAYSILIWILFPLL